MTEVQTTDANSRNSHLANRALTSLALLIQEQERDEAYGKVAVEVDFKKGVISQVRRILVATET